jgi:histone acetyltransferase 1
LIPFLQISFEQKAPAFANIDNIKEILEKHYGRVYENVSDYNKIVKEEESFKPQGEKLSELTLANGRTCILTKVSLDDESFHETSFYLQSMLPFFIDGASPIEPSPFWQYFLIYDAQTNNLLAFATVFEAHLNALRFRAKISQVLVLPPYQKQGLGHVLYSAIYDHYRRMEENCFQIIVEDSAEDFQRI